MLDDFCIEQPIAYKILKNTIKNNKCSHAYLVETNGYPKSFDFVLSFAKFLLCPNNCSNKINCNGCFQCENIDKNEFLELKIIEAEGQWIKKNQLDELQYEFSKKSILGNRKVYIIKNAEKLNLSSANSLLKFLEEPEEGIVAILMADNSSQLLDTIISRCQILKLKPYNKKNVGNILQNVGNTLYSTKNQIDEFVSNEANLLKIQKIIEFARYYEDNKLNTLIYTNKLWHCHFKEKNEFIDAFSILLLFYKDLLNFKLNKKLEIFEENVKEIKYISEKNKIDVIISKINVIMSMKEQIKFNANANLLIDKLIIELEGCENND